MLEQKLKSVDATSYQAYNEPDGELNEDGTSDLDIDENAMIVSTDQQDELDCQSTNVVKPQISNSNQPTHGYD